MNVRQLAKVACETTGCPTIFATDRGTVLVQGYVVPSGAAGLDVPSGELLVEIPRSLLLEGAAGLSHPG